MEQAEIAPDKAPERKKSFQKKQGMAYSPRTCPTARAAPPEGGSEQAEERHPHTNENARMNEERRESELWARIMQDTRLIQGVGEYGIEHCLSQMRLREDTGTALILEYPASVPIMWVEMNYTDHIVSVATSILKEARTVQYIEAKADVLEPPAEPEQPLLFAEQGEGGEQAAASPAPKRKSPRSKAASFNSGLNADYSFENFIVGDNSRFAYTAAQALVKNPGQYNPFFIHGASGLGKTHLLQAIGNAVREANEDTRVLYVTGEDFANHYIEAVTKGRGKGEALSNFRAKYRKADVLLIDDVQFLAAKDKTQDEFFYTFNALFESGKQIVLCSDCPAAIVKGLDERLRSRFEQGLSVELQAPAYETRMAILRSKIMRWKDALISDEVLDFLARNITRSVRRLEGALTRLAAVSSISARRPTLAEARQQVKDFLHDESNNVISIKDIQQCVADEFQLRVADLNSRRRIASLVHPRQIAMFIARHHTACSLQDIGAAFGGRNHGTVLHAERTIKEKMAEDPELRSTIDRMLATLGA